MLFEVYKTTNLNTGEFYIGMHRAKNGNDPYLGSSKRLTADVKRLGAHNFKREVLHAYENLGDALRCEASIIRDCLPDALCYNRPAGRTTPDALPLPVKRSLKAFGNDLRNARIRRRIKSEILAARCSISRTTLVKVENGDAGVSFCTVAAVIFSLGMIDRLDALLDLRHELNLTEEKRKRIR